MIAAIFVLKLCAGITLMWLLMPRKEVTDGFFRIQMRLVLGLAVLGVLLFTSLSSTEEQALPDSVAEAVIDPADSEDSGVEDATRQSNAISPRIPFEALRNSGIALCFVTYLGSIFWALGRRLPGNLCVYLSGLLALASLAFYAWTIAGSQNNGVSLLNVLSAFSSAAVAGSVLTGMLLGHWYLTTPSMSIQPLHWFNRTILVAAIARAIVLAIASVGYEHDGSPVWISMTWAGGVVTPIAVFVMVRRILVHRNTQSATGVLFAGLILVFMGEMTAILLQQATSVPF